MNALLLNLSYYSLSLESYESSESLAAALVEGIGTGCSD